MNRQDILRAAGDLIDGQRAIDYGDAAENFERIAVMWSAFLARGISPAGVACMMMLLKISRLANSTDHEDSYIDLCGYAALGAEIVSKEVDEDA